MATNYSARYASSPNAIKKYNIAELRDEFLIEDLMEPGKINFTYTHYDRYMAGSAVSIKALKLEAIDPLKAVYFLGRRDMGIINVEVTGKVTVDGGILATIGKLSNES